MEWGRTVPSGPLMPPLAVRTTRHPLNRAQAASPPIWRYRQTLVSTAEDGSFLLFGGESYKPYM